MKRKTAYFIVSVSVLFALVLTSCGASNQVPPTTAGQTSARATSAAPTNPIGAKDTLTVQLKKLDGSSMTKTVERPKYGGTITGSITSDYTAFDPYLNRAITVGHMQFTSNELVQGNLFLGPIGTNDVDWLYGYNSRVELESGELAESWELPDDQTVIWHIRHSVHYQNIPPVSGRELTAQDVAWWLDAQYNKQGLWQNVAYPPAQRPTSFKALDKYTVEVKVPAAYQSIQFMEMGDNAYTSPPELWTQYGGVGNDWRKYVGTGPFIMKDYVNGSSATYVRNPNYFEADLTNPGAQIPYIDGFKQLIIPDTSTRLAAFRTGKLDYQWSIMPDDAKGLRAQQPQLLETSQYYSGISFSMPAGRIDKPPFDDIRVRQALNMAIDQKTMRDQFWGGAAGIAMWPFPDNPVYAPYYTPFDKMPDNVKMLYNYDPVKAKQLLADAGYPNGFKTTIVCSNLTENIDLLSVVKEYFSKIGVDMAIQPIEPVAWTNMRINHTQQPGNMFYAPGVYATDQPLTIKPGTLENFAWVSDPYYQKLYDAIGFFLTKPKEFQTTVKEAIVYQLASAWGVWLPRPKVWNMYWPWLKAYGGITSSGWANYYDCFKFAWVDQDLKRSMGY